MPISPDQILVIIPALNEEEALLGVIRELQQHALTRICIVDNGSTDRTAEIAREAGAEVISEPRRGYGQACWTGSQSGPTDDIQWFLFCDADGSDDLTVLPEMLDAADEVPFVLADRRASAGSRAQLTPVQNFGNWLASTLIRLGWGARFHDLGPLRLIRRDVYERLEMQDRGFGWTVEMQARIAELKIPFREIPMEYRPRQGGVSKISGNLKGSFQAGSIILSTLGQLWLEKSCIRLMRLILSGLLVLAGSAWMMPHGEFHVAGTVPDFLIGAGIASFGFILCWGIQGMHWWWFWGVAIGARLLLLPMYPGDDIWRYLWEGMIQNHGHNPYLLAPDAAELASLRNGYWPLINHPQISAVYPPITQLCFRIIAGIAESALWFKTVFVVADLATCWLLLRRFGLSAALVYAWNPLVLYNFAGAGHYDSLLILALVGAWLLIDRHPSTSAPNRTTWLLAALLLGVSVGIKLVTLPLLVFVGIRIWQRFGWRYALCSGFVSAVPILFSALVLFWDHPVTIPDGNRGDFVLAARSAEFIPGIVGHLWPPSLQMNYLFTLPLALVCCWLIFRGGSFRSASEWFFFWLLILSPAVHGWYFTWIIPFAVASANLGIRLASITGFTYYLLQERVASWSQSTGNPWQLTPLESACLWLPFVIGFLYWKFTKESAKVSA